ncbi:hypothetical protein [Mesorhizobium sp. B4-1-1]|uniref:hypothetical protein n=1 Tax=Mesorhizobium sp. B4-1-1 TaxID=2589890 RepID=UPI0015E2954B|nr:hypothetical protein [Mesorhizobium sp. B4-1-1]
MLMKSGWIPIAMNCWVMLLLWEIHRANAGRGEEATVRGAICRHPCRDFHSFRDQTWNRDLSTKNDIDLIFILISAVKYRTRRGLRGVPDHSVGQAPEQPLQATSEVDVRDQMAPFFRRRAVVATSSDRLS